MNKLTVRIEEEQGGERVDKALSNLLPDLSRSALQRLLESGAVTINGQTAAKKEKVSAGDVVELTVPDPVLSEAKPEDIPLDIVYEDADLLVVNKPKGMVVHPAAGNPDGTLVNALLFHCGASLSGIGGVIRPGIVHRIDKDTSGLLIVAKNDAAHNHLAAQIKEHSFTREYEAVVHGKIKDDRGTIHAPIGRHPKDRKKMAVIGENGRDAVTHYTVLERLGAFTYVRLALETGRTHQIRVHLARIGHPVAGDALYGPKKPEKGLEGQCLHAKSIGFIHPGTGERLFFDSELPPYFTAFLSKHGVSVKNRDGLSHTVGGEEEQN